MLVGSLFATTSPIDGRTQARWAPHRAAKVGLGCLPRRMASKCPQCGPSPNTASIRFGGWKGMILNQCVNRAFIELSQNIVYTPWFVADRVSKAKVRCHHVELRMDCRVLSTPGPALILISFSSACVMHGASEGPLLRILRSLAPSTPPSST